MTAPINIGSFEAKTHFSQLLEQVEQGAQFVITRRGKKIAQLMAVENEKPSADHRAAATAQMREKLRAQGVSFTTDEILEMIREGRR
ncbi:antitoxin [Campylobacterota bacterium]|nr:antitoxin [Campylobacterota bacterium]